MKPLAADRHLIAYGRMRGSNQCVVVVNNAEEGRRVEVPVWELGIADGQELRRVMLTHSEGYNAGIEKYKVEEGKLVLDMPGCSGALFSVGAGSKWCEI